MLVNLKYNLDRGVKMISKSRAVMIGIALVLVTSILTFMITNTVEVVMGERVVVSKTDY